MKTTNEEIAEARERYGIGFHTGGDMNVYLLAVALMRLEKKVESPSSPVGAKTEKINLSPRAYDRDECYMCGALPGEEHRDWLHRV